jgi:hypothetical protein
LLARGERISELSGQVKVDLCNERTRHGINGSLGEPERAGARVVEITNNPMSTLPLLLIPALLVQWYLILHMAALLQSRKLICRHAYEANAVPSEDCIAVERWRRPPIMRRTKPQRPHHCSRYLKALLILSINVVH